MNVSAGDHAYIIYSAISENIGRIVKVIYLEFGDDFWLCEAIGGSISGFRDGEIVTTGRDIYCRDCDLRRIAGPSIKIDVDTEHPIDSEVMA